MNAIGALFTVVAAIAMLLLPRRYAVVPLLLSAAYMTSAQVLDIGGANFTVPRLLVTVGFVRALLRGEGLLGGLQAIDRLMLLWGVVLVLTSAFHTSDAWVYRLGIAWSELGTYFLLRIWLRDVDDLRALFKVLSVALLPLAVLMLMEKQTGRDPFSVLGGVGEYSTVRKGHIRANGPFSHAILAGTVGAAVFAMGIALWQRARLQAIVGIAVGLAIVHACASSGPMLMVGFILLGLATWFIRGRMRVLRALIVASLLALNAVMNDPVYFLMARIDLVGGSQGWFRAQLIRSSIEHLSEWWLAGTDYTRHWMSTGIHASDRHTDMTNHILMMGVLGGLPLMVVFVAILAISFRNVGLARAHATAVGSGDDFFIWTLGAMLFGFIMSFLSITLFDQTVLFFWMNVAALGTAAASCARSLPSRSAIAPRALPARRHGGSFARRKAPAMERS